jgi:microcin C transport system permease protein
MKFWKNWKFSDLSRQRLQKFRSIRRAWWSLIILGSAFLISLTSPWLVNDKPLILSWEGEWYYPAFQFYADSTFGGRYATEADYHQLVKSEKFQEKGWVLMPPIAHSPIRSHTMDEMDTPPPYAPSSKHWLGTDTNGRDILARLIHGFRICMLFSLSLVVLSAIMGIIIGGIQGLKGGKTDLVMQRGIEIWSTLPFLYVVILVGSIFGRSFSLLLLITALFSWIGLSYYMRGEFLRLRQMDFVKSAGVLGLSKPYIFFKEVLPNALTPVITILPFSLIGGIGSLTALDFLGFGLQPPTPSWGELLGQGLSNLYAPWITLSAVLALFITLLLATFIGEGVRAAMDPRSGDRYE